MGLGGSGLSEAQRIRGFAAHLSLTKRFSIGAQVVLDCADFHILCEYFLILLWMLKILNEFF